MALLGEQKPDLVFMELVLPDGKTKRGFVHRKGATRAFPPGHPQLAGTRWAKTGHPCLIPGSMLAGAAILFPKDGAYRSACSVNHGSGRLLGRNEAKRELGARHDLIDREMREIAREFGPDAVRIEGIVGNTPRTPLDGAGPGPVPDEADDDGHEQAGGQHHQRDRAEQPRERLVGGEDERVAGREPDRGHPGLPHEQPRPACHGPPSVRCDDEPSVEAKYFCWLTRNMTDWMKLAPASRLALLAAISKSAFSLTGTLRQSLTNGVFQLTSPTPLTAASRTGSVSKRLLALAMATACCAAAAIASLVSELVAAKP